MNRHWKTAWITGASTGIGRALALQLAKQGVRVAASARDAVKLDALVSEQAGITAFPLDVTDHDAVATTYAAIARDFGAIDLAVLNAGVWDPMSADDFDARRVAATMAVNHTGIANALEPLLKDMIARRAGQIALVASVAGYRGLPKAVAYAPSKAAVISLAEVLRLDLARHDVMVNLINPGFVETPMTSVNRFPMPFMVTADDAAVRIIAGLRKGKFEIAFPWQLVALMKALRLAPYPAYYAFVRRFIAKG